MTKNRVVYNSGLCVWNRGILSTLCVFYDEVLLPFSDSPSDFLSAEYEYKGDGFPQRTTIINPFDSNHQSFIHKDLSQIEKSKISVVKWDELNKPLFSEGVLNRLFKPPFQGTIKVSPRDWKSIRPSLINVEERFVGFIETRPLEGEVVSFEIVRKDLIIHLLRNDVFAPGIFFNKNQETDREILKSLMASSVFKILLPNLERLHPEEILEVRNKVAATREGFSLHLQSLSAEVEKRIKEGDQLKDITRYATSVIETQLIPDYYEFKRQLSAERSGFWCNVLDKFSKVAEISSAPWTPAFYAELLKALGFSFLTGISEHKRLLSNRSQAFQFLKIVGENTMS